MSSRLMIGCGLVQLMLALAAAPARAQCEPAWQPTFGQATVFDEGQAPSATSCRAMCRFDDGSGEALYVGGRFHAVGGIAARGVAKFDGTTWSAVGNGPLGPLGEEIRALTVFDDGQGPALYAAGSLTSTFSDGVARWNGTSWTNVGGVMNNLVNALAVFDDGAGPALHVGGGFTTVGGAPVKRLARWDGAQWAEVGAGLTQTVTALGVFDDGSGENLFVSATPLAPGPSFIWRWTGSGWYEPTAMNGPVFAMLAHDLGAGPTLYAGGMFSLGSGSSASYNVAAIAGADTTSFDGGLGGPGYYVTTLAVFDDGNGARLYAGGHLGIDGFVTRWDGAWTSLTQGLYVADDINVLASFDDGSGPRLYAGGAGMFVDNLWNRQVGRWDGTSWRDATKAVAFPIGALAVYDSGDGPQLHAAAAPEALEHLAFPSAADALGRWNGSTWSALGSGLSDIARALTVHDDGQQSLLVAGGEFLMAGGISANRIAAWDGTNWSALGSGMNQLVLALTSFDDGSGPALYAGGGFTSAGGVAAARIARWDGMTWSPLGSGMNGTVSALAVHDDGSGPALYAAGYFTLAGGQAANRVAKWNGATWSALGAGVNGPVLALASFDDGGGSELYAAGEFTLSGIFATNRIARWDGTAWAPLSGGLNGTARCLTVLNDGSGPGLIVGGDFSMAVEQSTSRIARWSGRDWFPLGGGLTAGNTLALAVLDDGNGPSLIAAGTFLSASGSLDSNLARWTGCPTWTDLGFALPGTAGNPVLAGSGSLASNSQGLLVLSNASPSALAALFISLGSTPHAFKCGTLVALPSLAVLTLPTSPAGSIPAGWSAWPAGLSGLSLHFQYAILDSGAICGVALSNALLADVP